MLWRHVFVYLAFLKATGSRLFAFTRRTLLRPAPCNVENVAWTAERKSILNAVFWFSAIIALSRLSGTRSFESYGLTIIFHILGLAEQAR